MGCFLIDSVNRMSPLRPKKQFWKKSCLELSAIEDNHLYCQATAWNYNYDIQISNAWITGVPICLLVYYYFFKIFCLEHCLYFWVLC